MNTNRYKNPKILALSLLIISMFAMTTVVPLVNGFIGYHTTGGAAGVVLEGVASNDQYDNRQYSYKINEWANESNCFECQNQSAVWPMQDPGYMKWNATKSLRLGFTEYGEFTTNSHNAGIAYGKDVAEWTNTESWASTMVNPKYWIQGWQLYVEYIRAGITRKLTGYALFSDMITNEEGRKVYSWSGNASDLAVGSLIPSGVQILYDSARLVIGRSSVIIHDGKYNEDFARVTLTVIFNKDKKYATVLKDVKILLDPKVLDSITDFSFDERYELDLARKINTANRAYIHYFANYCTTDYQHPLTGSNMYDVIQAFDPLRRYIYFSGIWPNATEYSVHMPLVPDISSGSGTALTRILPPGFRTSDIPSPPSEPSTPWVTVQWRYNYANWPKMLTWLAKQDPMREIRFVEVLGMTDYVRSLNPALDINATDRKNQVDVEVQYLLNEVFNPGKSELNRVNDQPFMWIGLGQSAATTDSGGAGFLADLPQQMYQEPMVLFDRNDTAFPWTAPTIGMKGTIPYGLQDFDGDYIESFSNSAEGSGADTTTYWRTMLKGFAFGVYDDVEESPPQPIAGGWSTYEDLWYPSKDPLTERWSYSPWSMIGYDHIMYHPNGIIALGGPKANGLSRYFNDFNFAIQREGLNAFALVESAGVSGTAPTSNPSVQTLDYFPVTSWESSNSSFNFREGYAVIAQARDINGTRGLTVYGWDGRDTYWAAAWASQFLGTSFDDWIPDGCVAIILHIDYDMSTGEQGSREPELFTIVKALGTITEFGENAFATDPAYGFDKKLFNSTQPIAWTGTLKWMSLDESSPTFPHKIEGQEWSPYKVWWHEKLPTITTAHIQYDP